MVGNITEGGGMRLVVARNVVLSIVQGVLSFRFLEKERRGKKRKKERRPLQEQKSHQR